MARVATDRRQPHDIPPVTWADPSAAFSKCLALRDKYMTLSCQMLGDNPRDRDGTFGGFRSGTGDVYGLKPDQKPATCELSADPTAEQWQMNPPPPAPHWKWEGARPEHQEGQEHKPSTTTPEFDLAACEVPGPEDAASAHTYRLNDEGVYTVYTGNGYDKGGEIPLSHVPRLKEYYMDLEYLLNVCSDGPVKSFAFRRLKYLASKWSLYGLLNEYQELADMKAVPHRDFYNVRKVDTHIHHSASMNQKHLLRFIKRKLRRCPDEIVIHRDGKDLTLSEVFESLNLTAYDLSIDTLDMHAHQEFHRFDRFNNRYNPTGSSRLREIFLKTDNLLKGTYLAELTTELIADLEQSKYQNSEWRVSIYGRKPDEWDKLAKWVVENKLVSHNVRWLIQVPRLYEVFKAGGLVNNFEDVVKNVFKPLFEVTQDPSSHPELHIFLQRVVGFDSVDDESKPERRLYKKFPTAQAWDTNQSPPYSYWIYYMFANMASLNAWRRERGFSKLPTFSSVDSRHLRAPPALRRGGRPGPPLLGLPHLALDLPRHPPPQGPGPPVPLLPEAGGPRHVAPLQQRALPHVRAQPLQGLFQDRDERLAVYRRPPAVPLHRAAPPRGVLVRGADLQAHAGGHVRACPQQRHPERLGDAGQEALDRAQVLPAWRGRQRHPQDQRPQHPHGVPPRHAARGAQSDPARDAHAERDARPDAPERVRAGRAGHERRRGRHCEAASGFPPARHAWLGGPRQPRRSRDGADAQPPRPPVHRGSRRGRTRCAPQKALDEPREQAWSWHELHRRTHVAVHIAVHVALPQPSTRERRAAEPCARQPDTPQVGWKECKQGPVGVVLILCRRCRL